MPYPIININGENYQRLHRMSRGGMGEIILYNNIKNPEDTIVVKSPILAGELIDELFENEADIMLMLNEELNESSYMPELTNYLTSELHKGLKLSFPQLIEYRKKNPNDPNSRAFIAMAHKHRARNLEDIVTNMKSRYVLLPFPYIINIMKKICESDLAMHRLGYVHLDLNLRNVGWDKDIIIFDPGISNRIGEKLDPQITGTITNSAPELDENKVVDERTDLYSIGMIGYELSTGINPVRDLLKVIYVANPRAMTNEENEKVRSARIELKKNKRYGNVYLINPIEEEREKYNADKVPKGYQDLIEDLLEPKPKNRPSMEETIERLDKISRKNNYEKITNEEITSFMKDYMNTIIPSSFEELEEAAEKSRSFVMSYETNKPDREESETGYSSTESSTN